MFLSRHLKSPFFSLPFLFCLISFTLSAQNKTINGPIGSGEFGNTVAILPNGNYVVTDPLFDNAQADVGAVYLYNGATHALISTLTGSTANDKIGNGGITVLANGNYVVRSQNWDNGGIFDAGAATWCSGTTGRTGTISVSNSLVGSTTNDQIGSFGIISLTNGNYVVNSPNWDNGAIANTGAVTWCSGTTGRAGIINSSNSLVGASANDSIGNYGITTLSSGNCVVNSPYWDNGAAIDAGAITWCNGATGIAGIVSASISLVGSSTNDKIGTTAIVGANGIIVLKNGNYVVSSPYWNNGVALYAGAATWCNGTTGRVGVISASNSLVGTTSYTVIGMSGITALPNGNYVVGSPFWDNGPIADVGASTWCDGSTGRVGAINASNSLIGASASDNINSTITILSNGNYVVRSWNWDNGAIIDAGAVTWCDGTTGRVGVVSASNSLVGSSTDDNISLLGITALPNGNYVVNNSNWNNGAILDAGAVTWCDGTTGKVGVISSSNSLVGTKANDKIGNNGVIILKNGNYVVSSPYWDNGAISDAGAATWCSGSLGRVGVVNSSNSLVGSSADDNIGNFFNAPLSNGNYVINSPNWDNGAITNAGAVTWCNGTTGRVGAVSISNSLVGSSTGDPIGNFGVAPLSNGNYVVRSIDWDNGAITNAGAVTWCDGTTGRVGTISISNSLVGSSSGDRIGGTIYTSFSNGNYAVISSVWDNGAIIDAGAVTWCNGTTGRIGTINANNSLVGSSANDVIGNYYGFIPLSNGYHILRSMFWDNGAISNAGAMTLVPDNAEISGVINNCNSVLGNTNNLNPFFHLGFDVLLNLTMNYLIVSKSDENKIFIRPFSNDSSLSRTICSNQSFLWNGIARNTSGAYKDTFTSFFGCDSIVTLNLTVKPTSSSSFSQTICANQSFFWNGYERNTSGAFNDTFVSFSGCDSVVTLNLFIVASPSSINKTICANQSFLWNGMARNNSGAFEDTFTSFNGCDSVVTLNLTVTPLPSKLTNTTGNTITAAQAGATYQWINCATNTSITGANAQSFTPSSNGSFKVVVTQTNCSDTSACVPINSVGINQNNLSTQVQIYPNPARESLTVLLSAADNNASIVLLSLDGKKLQSYPLTQKINMLPISTLSPGFYLYEISFNGNIEKGKLLIEE